MKKWIEGFLFVAMFAIAGCPPPSNSAAVLEGTWKAVFDEPGDLELFEIQLTFDSNGDLTQIKATAPEGGTATLDTSDTSTSEVDGDQVTITVPIAAGTRVFEGTLSEDENSIDGSLSNELDLSGGDLDVTLPGGDLTLTRLES